MDIQFLESFLRINGPWMLVGVLLFLWWDKTRRDERAITSRLELTNQIMEEVVETLKQLNQCLTAVRDVVVRVDEKITDRSRRLKS